MDRRSVREGVVSGVECAIVLDEERQIIVPLSARELVIDPTDKQIAGATNVSRWFGVEGDRATEFRAMLCGELSTADWELRRKS